MIGGKLPVDFFSTRRIDRQASEKECVTGEFFLGGFAESGALL